MQFSLFVLYFLFFSVIGWILDVGYTSLMSKRFVNKGFFSHYPIRPIYGFGGLLLVVIYKLGSSLNLFTQFGLAWFAMVVLEYCGGVFCHKVLKKRLWNYSKQRWHIQGHITLVQSVYWYILVVIFYFLLFPLITAFEKNTAALAFVSWQQDVFMSSLFWILFAFLVILHKKFHFDLIQ